MFHASKGDDACLLLKIDRDPNIPVAIGNGPWVSRLTSRGVPISLQNLEESSKCPMQLDRIPDFNEQTRVLKVLPTVTREYTSVPGRNWRKTMRLPPSPRDEALCHCIACRAIPCSPSNNKGALTSFMELQRVPKDTVTSLEAT